MKQQLLQIVSGVALTGLLAGQVALADQHDKAAASGAKKEEAKKNHCNSKDHCASKDKAAKDACNGKDGCNGKDASKTEEAKDHGKEHK